MGAACEPKSRPESEEEAAACELQTIFTTSHNTALSCLVSTDQSEPSSPASKAAAAAAAAREPASSSVSSCSPAPASQPAIHAPTGSSPQLTIWETQPIQHNPKARSCLASTALSRSWFAFSTLSPPVSPPPPLVFPRFSELPAELRLAIWESALPAGPRVVRPRLLGLGKFPGLGDYFYLSHVGPPALFWACREAQAVALNGVAAATLRGSWVDLREDIVFFPLHDRPYRTTVGRLGGAIPECTSALMSFYLAPQIAVEVSWDDEWTEWLVRYTTQYVKPMARLYLVVPCILGPPTQNELNAGWLLAERIHIGRQALDLEFSFPLPFDKHPAPEIVILLDRRKYAFPAGTWSMDSKDFLGNFTAVTYKPGHQAKIGRNGVLQSILPI